MRLKTHLLLIGLLTGVLIETALADEEQRGNCPPPPPGPPPQFEQGAGGPPPFDHRGPGPGPRGGFHVQMLLGEFDLDKDGRISRAEIDRVLKRRFEDADADNDGRLDPEEFAHALPMGAPPFGGPMHHRGPGCGPRGHGDGDHGPGPGDRHPPFDPKAAFNHFDWNLDGVLTFEEFAAPVRQMALHLDRNGDGVIDAEEMKGPPMMFGPGFAPPPGMPPEPPRDRESP